MRFTADELVEKGVQHKRESKYVEFKSEFNPTSKEFWCFLVKELVALANTKGGVVVIGLHDNSEPSGADVRPVLQLDPAEITDKVHRYTGYQFSEFEVHECEKSGHQLSAIVVHPVDLPLVFEKPGAFGTQDGGQAKAFSEGKVYFRHGAKSEPGDRDDLRNAYERLLDTERQRWLDGVERVVHADPGSKVAVLPPQVVQSTETDATPIRLVKDPGAPAYHIVDPDQTHPFRLTEVVQEVNERLPDGEEINRHDILSVRAAHSVLDEEQFVYSPRYGSY